MDDKRSPKLRTWKYEDMKNAYHAAKYGGMSVSKASRMYNVPRMTLSDRVKGHVSLDATMGAATALDESEEEALVNYISYMAHRGFPLNVSQVCGYAWCIAKEHNKARVFSEKGPSGKWWRGFKSRHPDIALRRPDALDRGRAAMGNVAVMKDYFELLQSTLESNELKDHPDRIYNCDEADPLLTNHPVRRLLSQSVSNIRIL